MPFHPLAILTVEGDLLFAAVFQHRRGHCGSLQNTRFQQIYPQQRVDKGAFSA